jgi:DNA mismatch repair ATPase MutS
MGKRLFKYNLLSPITDTKEICNRYDTIDMLMNNDTYDILRHDLGSIYDLERLFRRLLLGVLQPCEMATIDLSLQAVCSLHTKLTTNTFDIKRLGWSNEAFDELKEWMDYYAKRMDMELMSTCTLQQITGNLFVKGV